MSGLPWFLFGQVKNFYKIAIYRKLLNLMIALLQIKISAFEWTRFRVQNYLFKINVSGRFYHKIYILVNWPVGKCSFGLGSIKTIFFLFIYRTKMYIFWLSVCVCLKRWYMVPFSPFFASSPKAQISSFGVKWMDCRLKLPQLQHYDTTQSNYEEHFYSFWQIGLQIEDTTNAVIHYHTI